MLNAVDEINVNVMRSKQGVAEYSVEEQLHPHEKAALDRVAAEFLNQPILDLGVGAGRSVRALRRISDNYLGIDYSPEMIAACEARYPTERFAYADARHLTDVAANSIALAVFSCNGIGMVAHDDRLLILREVRRVLRPGGVFVFTTHNRNSPEATAGFRWPEFQASRHPIRLAVRSLRFIRDTVLSLRNRLRYVKYEQHNAHYSIINDRCHNHGIMLYYISLAQQRQQLIDQGFEPNAEAFDGAGNLIRDDTTTNSMALIARKAAV